MSVLAYSELMRRIVGVEESELERPFKILSDHNTTSLRLAAIKELSRHESISIGKLLQTLKQPRGGGSYLTVRKYFMELEKTGLLVRTRVGNRTEWGISKKNEDFKRYVMS